MVVRDVLAVVWGPRSGVLLSYVHGHGENTIRALRKVVEMMKSDLQYLVDSAADWCQSNNNEKEKMKNKGHVSVMVFDGCLLLIRVDRLLDRVMPRGISFVENDDSGILSPGWMTEGEQDALEASFQRIIGCLLSFCSEEQDGLDMERCFVDHDIFLGIDGAPCPPTLYGWLLGYPVTYQVTSADHAAQVSRCLSCNTLVLYSLRAMPRVMYGGEDTLMSFSIPQCLHGDVAEDIVRTWMEDMRGECHQELWSSPELTVASKKGDCIVL